MNARPAADTKGGGSTPPDLRTCGSRLESAAISVVHVAQEVGEVARVERSSTDGADGYFVPREQMDAQLAELKSWREIQQAFIAALNAESKPWREAPKPTTRAA